MPPLLPLYRQVQSVEGKTEEEQDKTTLKYFICFNTVLIKIHENYFIQNVQPVYIQNPHPLRYFDLGHETLQRRRKHRGTGGKCPDVPPPM